VGVLPGDGVGITRGRGEDDADLVGAGVVVREGGEGG
jgi:hypothetical protein